MPNKISKNTEDNQNRTILMFAAFFLGGLVIGAMVFGGVFTNKALERENNILKEYLRINVFGVSLDEEGEEIDFDHSPISGVITEISVNAVRVDTGISEAEIIVTGKPRFYDVTVSEDTVIVLRKERDWHIYEQEVAEYERTYGLAEADEDLAGNADIPAYPLSYDEEELALGELMVGAWINITPVGRITGSNFEAEQITAFEYFADEEMEI